MFTIISNSSTVTVPSPLQSPAQDAAVLVGVGVGGAAAMQSPATSAIAMLTGPLPTGISETTMCAVASVTTTELPLATYTRRLSGVTASALGLAMWTPVSTICVDVSITNTESLFAT